MVKYKKRRKKSRGNEENIKNFLSDLRFMQTTNIKNALKERNREYILIHLYL